MIALCIAWAIAASGQSSESGQIIRNGQEAVLTVDSPRPLDSAAITLAEEFGIATNAEDPQYLYSGDLKDVTAEVARVPNPRRRILVPKGGRLEVQFRVRPDGSPEDVRRLLQSMIDAANSQFPFAYRLDIDGDAFTFVPTRTRDGLGNVIDVTPLLDRRVTIPAGRRTVLETVKRMTDALSAQTGIHIGCCQAGVGGYPWGMEEITFEARDEPARVVLMRLIRSAPGRYYWLMRCDPSVPLCFINLRNIRQNLTLRLALPASPSTAYLGPKASNRVTLWRSSRSGSCSVKALSKGVLFQPRLGRPPFRAGLPTHLALEKDVPDSLEPMRHGAILAMPQVGGLHHSYERRAA